MIQTKRNLSKLRYVYFFHNAVPMLLFKQLLLQILDPKGTTVHSETADFPVKTPIVFTYNVELNGVHKACVTALGT